VTKAAVFLDRDGVLLYDFGYLARLEDLRWYSCAIEAVRLLNRAGFLVFVLTNQGGIGLGLYSERFVRATHDAMAKSFEAGGAHVDEWFFCPHHPRATIEDLRIICDCRKPETGMVRAAEASWAIDLTRSFVVGDKATDMGLAERVGARGVLVRTGQGEAELARAGGTMRPAWIAPDLAAATAWMIAADREGGGHDEAGRDQSWRDHER
jgi:D-glycero-D-manno-heptose 1,7-bisphosphate phosphatase